MLALGEDRIQAQGLNFVFFIITDHDYPFVCVDAIMCLAATCLFMGGVSKKKGFKH